MICPWTFMTQPKGLKLKATWIYTKKYLEKAYILEKEAALKIQSDSSDSTWQFMLLRSAGWMALECGQFKDAKILVDIGLSKNPNGLAQHELKELSKEIKKKQKNINENEKSTQKIQRPFLALFHLPMQTKLILP